MMGLGRWCAVGVAAAVCLPLAAATRPVTLQGAAAGEGEHPYCAVLDAAAFAEAAPGLRGLHLMQDGREIPFLTTVSEPQSGQTDAARVLHLREQNGALLFDLAMPERAYTELVFRLRLQDFVAVAEISASDAPGDASGRRVGEFKLFDLSRDHLARQTAAQLPETRARYLHVSLHAQGKALHGDDLEGVDVLPDRVSQSVYTGVVATAKLNATDRETIAEMDVPAHVPVLRIRFETTAQNFLRHVRVEAWPVSDPHDVETVSGTISSTHRVGLADAQLLMPMTLGANLQGPARVRVIVENDGQPAVALKRVALEMREHKICFAGKSGTSIVLMEGGDEAVPSSVGALAQQSWEHAGAAVLGEAVESGSVVTLDLKDGADWELDYRVRGALGVGVLVLLAGVVYFIRRRVVRKARG